MTNYPDNIIFIEGGAYDSIKRALRQWIEMYADELEADLVFELFRNGRGKHVIVADERLSDEQFAYLVNYLYYPERIDYRVRIEGFTTATDTKFFPGEYINKKLLLFIPEDDQEHDNVYAVTSDDNVIKVDFGGKVTKENISKKFSEPEIDLSSLTVADTVKVLKVSQKNLSRKSNLNADIDIIRKRFKILVLVVMGSFVLCWIKIRNPQAFLQLNFAICFGVWVWFVADYKMLQINRYYVRSVILSLGIAFYCYMLFTHLDLSSESHLSVNMIILPIFFLIVQRPLRFAFKAIMKREPIVGRPAPSFADFVYIFILWMGSLVPPMLFLN